jgi:hypothetical protein
MPANTSPIFTLTPRFSAGSLVTANNRTSGDGSICSGCDMVPVFRPGPNGSYLYKLRFCLAESVIGTASNPCVLRVFVSNAPSVIANNTNTWLIGEVNCPEQTPTANLPAVAFDVILNFTLKDPEFLVVTSSNPILANTSWIANVWGGDY